MEESTNTSTVESKPSKKKNKKLLGIIIGIIVLVMVIGGGVFAYKSMSAGSTEDDDYLSTSDLPELTPEDIGMVVTLRDDNRALMFELTKADDIEHVEYTIEYEAQTDEGIANQGIFGEMNIGDDGITKTDYREFGTCSAGKCRYDDVVSDITINLKVTKKDGKEYQVKKVVKIPTSSPDDE